jgi:putative component of toxin-antitoxin plasmid stabilization module
VEGRSHALSECSQRIIGSQIDNSILQNNAIYGTILGVRIGRSKDFLEWFEQLTPKVKAIVEARLCRILEQDHFGDVKTISSDLIFGGLISKAWKLCIWFLGGNKNGQKKDIKRTKLYVKQITENETEDWRES